MLACASRARYHSLYMTPWMIYAILAAVAAGAVGILAKLGITGADATVATTLRGLSIALFMGAAAFFLGKWETVTSMSSRSFFFIVLTGIVGGLSWLWGFMALQKGGGVTVVNAIDRMSLVLVLIFAAMFLGEGITWNKAVGVVFIVLGVILATTTKEQLVDVYKFIARMG